MKGHCLCYDTLCPVHKGTPCSEKGIELTILYRVDMQDESGTAFCEDCADDAMESGVFTDSKDDE